MINQKREREREREKKEEDGEIPIHGYFFRSGKQATN
jgi:hypothetical protein